MLLLFFHILPIRFVQVEQTEVLWRVYVRYLHVVSIAIIQICIGGLNTHEHVAFELNRGRSAIYFFRQYAAGWRVVVVGHKGRGVVVLFPLDIIQIAVRPILRKAFVHEPHKETAEAMSVFERVYSRVVEYFSLPICSVRNACTVLLRPLSYRPKGRHRLTDHR